MQNRVEDDQEALWSRHAKNIARDPDLQNRRGYWKEVAKQADAIIEKYKDEKNLTPAEKSSLTVAKISRDRFKQKSEPKYLQRAGRFSIKLFTGLGKGVANSMLRGINGSFKEMLSRSPWYIALLGHGVRAIVGLAANVINTTMKAADFLTDWLLPKVPPLKAGTGRSKPEDGPQRTQGSAAKEDRELKPPSKQQNQGNEQAQSNGQQQGKEKVKDKGSSKWTKREKGQHPRIQPKDSPLSGVPAGPNAGKDNGQAPIKSITPGPQGNAPSVVTEAKVRAPVQPLVPPPQHKRVIDDAPTKGLGPRR